MIACILIWVGGLAIGFWLGHRAGHQSSDRGWIGLARQAAEARRVSEELARQKVAQEWWKKGGNKRR